MPVLTPYKWPIALLAAFLPVAAKAETPTLQQAIGDPADFTLSGSTRLRYESIIGQPRPGFVSGEDLVVLRTTLRAAYDAGTLRFEGELYDSRAWLSRPGSVLGTNEVNTFELVQAFVAADIAEPLGEGSTLKLQAGRFTLAVGSSRLVAADNFRNTTNGSTGLRADLTAAGGLAATAFYVLPQQRLPDDFAALADNRSQIDREGFEAQLWGGLISRADTLAGATAEIGYVGFAERDRPARATRNRNLDTFTGRLIRNPAPGRFDFEGEAMWQTGRTRAGTATDAAELDVSASFFHAEGGYTFASPLGLRLALEFDRAGGDTPGGTFARFDTLFGMRRADLAPSGLYNSVGRANIAAVGLRAEFNPAHRVWDSYLTYRPLWLANRRDSFSTTNVRDPAGASGSFAGHQVEGRLRYWLVPSFLRAEFNAVFLAKGRFLETAPNAPRNGNTLYLASAIVAEF